MSNSEDDSFAEVENKDTVQLEDSPQWKSVCKSLNRSASPNAKGDQASVAPSYSEPQTEKIGIKADLPNIRRVIGNRRNKSTKIAQETPIDSVNWRNRKASCVKDSGGRCKDSKKRSKIKPGTSMRISKYKYTSHISDISRSILTTSKIKTRLISDSSTSTPTDKSVCKQIVSKYEVESTSPKKGVFDILRPTKCDKVQRELHTTVESKKLVENSQTAQSLCVKQKFEKQKHPSLPQGKKPQNVQPNPMDFRREVESAKKVETPTNATANEYIGSGYRHYYYPPGIYFAEPVRRKSVKILVEEFEGLILQAERGCQKETERKQKSLGKWEDNKQRISDIAAKTSMIRPENVQSSSTPRTSFSFVSSFISPENVQPASRINISNERISPLNSTEKALLGSKINVSLLKKYLYFEPDETWPRSNARISLPNEKTSSTSSEKAQPRLRTKISLPNEITQLSSPEEGQLDSRERTSFLKEVACPLISPEMVQSCSRINLSNEKVSPLINTEKAQLGSQTRFSRLIGPENNQPSKIKIIIPNERTSVISPEKIQLSSRSQIILNEKTSFKKQPENVTVQSDAGKAAMPASDAQPSILQEGDIPAIRTLKYEEVLRSSSTERQNESKQAEFLGALLLERKDLTRSSLEFQRPIVIEHLRSNTEAETPKDSTERGKTLRSRANNSGEISSPSSSMGPAENVLHENKLDIGSETTPVSHVQSSIVPGGSGSKVNIGVRPIKISRSYFEQQDTFEESLDALNYITSRGMKKLDLILEEMEKRCREKYPRSDWVDSTKEAQETELATLRELSRIVTTEFEETQEENEESASHPSNIKSPEDGSGTAAVEQLQNLKSKSGSVQEKGSPDQQAGGELDKVDLSARLKSARALFEILQAIKIDRSLKAWMELLRIFYRIDIGERLQTVRHERMQLREEKTTGQNVKLSPPLNIDSSNENRSESSIDLVQKENSKEPLTFSSQNLQENVKINVGDEKPKQIDQLRGKALGSKPTYKTVSSKESSLEEKLKHRFYRVSKENLLIKEQMRRKRTNRKEEGEIPAVDSVASPRIVSGGDLLSRCTQIKEKDSSGDPVSKYSDVQEVENSENNLKNFHRLPLDELETRELLQIFDKIFGDMFSAFIQSNMNNF